MTPLTDSEREEASVQKQIRITVTDLETGEEEVAEIADDYVLICAGSAFTGGIQTYPGKGTHVITVKGLRR